MIDITIVESLRESDYPQIMPDALYNEFLSVVRNAGQGNPVIHQIKSFIDANPSALQEAGVELAFIYFLKGDSSRAETLVDRILKNSPDFIDAINLKTDLMIEREEFDLLENFTNLNLPFEQQFPFRKKVTLQEYANYEVSGIRWLLVNEDNDTAIERTLRLMEDIKEFPGASEYLEIVSASFEDYVPEDEFTVEMEKLIADIEELTAEENDHAYPPPPAFSVLTSQILIEDDLPAVLGLLDSPREELVPGLYDLVDEILEEHLSGNEDHDNVTHQVWLSFLLLAKLGDEKLMDKWVEVLSQNKDFIETWIGDELDSELFYVGYRAGLNDPERLAAAIDLQKLSADANFSLLISLCGIAWLHPEKKPVAVNKIKSLLKELLAINFGEFTPDYRRFTTELIDQACLLDKNYFAGEIKQSVEDDRIDLNMMDPSRLEAISEKDIPKRFQYKILKESFEQKMKRIYSE